MKKLKNNWITKTTSTRLYDIPVPILALTGGIATGKSTVAQLFREENIPVIDADKLVKGIYSLDESIEFIKTHFPESINAGIIDFKILRTKAFASTQNQQLIENFIYAKMPIAFKEAYLSCKDHHFIVYDVPLLFEKELDKKIDVSLCVYSPREIQLKRLIARDQISVELANTILDKQIDIEIKRKKSHLVIENTKDLDALKVNFNNTLSALTI